jgi:hypothetical protein
MRRTAFFTLCIVLLAFTGKLYAADLPYTKDDADYYAKKRISGIVFTSTGGVSLVAGTILFCVNIPKMHGYETGTSAGILWDTPDGLVGAILGISGLICTVVGVSKWVVGSSELHYQNKEIKAPKETLHLEIAPGGSRLVMNF